MKVDHYRYWKILRVKKIKICAKRYTHLTEYWFEIALK